MRKTSQAAYHQHSVTGALLSQRQYILEFIKENGPHTRQQISDVTGIPINCVTPRITELLEMEKVTDTRTVKTAYGRRAHLVEVADV